MTVSTMMPVKLFGLLELDAEGMVLYSRTDNGDNVRTFSNDIRGLNFYSEVAPFKNVTEFKECLDNFKKSSQQAHTISFTCQYDDGPVQVRVLMARIRERSEHDATRSMLVHIRKAL